MYTLSDKVAKGVAPELQDESAALQSARMDELFDETPVTTSPPVTPVVVDTGVQEDADTAPGPDAPAEEAPAAEVTEMPAELAVDTDTPEAPAGEAPTAEAAPAETPEAAMPTSDLSNTPAP